MSYLDKKGKFDSKKWLRLNPDGPKIKEEVLTEEYIEIMDGLDDGLQLIVDAWKEWKDGPMTEPGDIKPAQKELLSYVERYLKKNIK